ncbi:S24 family peptidase [Sphingomonas mesophila]|uniref:S24 family peptidase n=1 Tax=Sphingomonas mesophila TaxID=2303576 RepID=UPI000E56C432|nr:S24 family peptidase [Sphingomonas mesophila]
MPNDPRKALERLCAERGQDFAGLSRLIGRNPAYIQQFIRRGTPKRLKEDERRTLADFFGVAESLLGGPPGRPGDGMVAVPRRQVSAAAGSGAEGGDNSGRPYFAFDSHWLRQLTAAASDDLSMIRVQGDSMAPTLNDGDDILLDVSQAGQPLRDGIYVLRIEDSLLVKRLAVHPLGRTVTVQSDNPAYPDWPDCKLSTIHCIGRVIWAGRKVA